MIICPKQSAPHSEEGLFNKLWYLFFNSISPAIEACKIIQDTHLTRSAPPVATVTNAAWAGNVATLTVGANHRMIAGLTAQSSGISPSGYNAVFVITAVTATTISFGLTTNPGAFTADGSVEVKPTYPAASFPGATFYETDRRVFYLSKAAAGTVNVDAAGTAVTWVSGGLFLQEWAGRSIVINGMARQIASVTNVVSLTLASAVTGTPLTAVPYQQKDYFWTYTHGTFPVTLSPDTKPTDLGGADYFFRIESVDFNHSYYWAGTFWAFAQGDCGSEYVAMGSPAGGAPKGGLWGICDGTAYTCAQSDGTLVSRTTKNYTGDVFIMGAATPDAAQRAAAVQQWAAGAKTDTHTHNVTVSGEGIVNGAGAAQTVGADGTYTSTAVSANLSDANAVLKVPSEANGGVPLRIAASWYIRR